MFKKKSFKLCSKRLEGTYQSISRHKNTRNNWRRFVRDKPKFDIGNSRDENFCVSARMLNDLPVYYWS